MASFVKLQAVKNSSLEPLHKRRKLVEGTCCAVGGSIGKDPPQDKGRNKYTGVRDLWIT